MSANSSNSSFVTDRSMLYGSYVGVNSDANQMEMLWYATPSETDGVYSLQWNETGDETADKVLLSLRTTAPSNKVDDDDE